ncbi:OmpA family protein [Flavobacterium sp.]|uniref:OmpA family protein n=1 Tax=Flavobacterium sp. TaxID=239 RepID=UPI0026144620|nr:OmpA family protein [Flavobacterium sp.]
MKKLVILCICLASTLIVKAQTQDKKWNIGLHGGIVQYHGDLGHDFYKTDNTMYGFGGLSISRYLGRYLDANVSFSRGELGYNNGETANFKSDFSAASVNLRINFIGPEYFVRPYAFGGIGVILFDNQLNFHKEKIDSALPTAGGGINFRLTPVLSLNLQESFMFTNNDARDGAVAGADDDFLFHSVGLTFNFGNSKDSDNDGVSDSRDNCPDTPAGVSVDKHGCPLDKDADGIADYLDTCPDVAGLKMLNGCPDRDNDGVSDGTDRCPDIAGSVALKGCPDADNDGVADLDDKCPNTKSGTRVDVTGCPMDNDKDGVLNDDDRCPDTAGPASLKGCPDTDGDGVPDIDDRCPNTKGNIANKGCPEITKEDIKKITYIGSKIFFENNSDKLKVASLDQLDELAKILNRYEGAYLIIEGHTDSNGSDEFNKTLSQKRTESVRAYLISKGIAESRLTGLGLGESKPIATNKTSLGRAKNRRVELKTTY